MSRVVWLDGAFVDPAAAALPIDDPGVRYGEGLFETMRAHDGAIALIDRHLARLARSIDALGLAPMPPIAAVGDAARVCAERLEAGAGRVRVTITPRPTLLVDAEPITLDPELTLTAATVRGAWLPGREIAQHKSLSFLGWRHAQRQAEAAGADIALLCDAAGRLGEASTANVFAVIDGTIVTPPIDGILPGVTRKLVMEAAAVREAHLPEEAWREAAELFLTSGVRGVVPLTAVDGHKLAAGPVTAGLRETVERILTGAGRTPPL